MQVRKAGFTLLETTIALFIVCSMVVISTWNLKDYQAKVSEKETLTWFKDNFKSAMNYSYIHNRAAGFQVETTSKKLIFNFDKRNVGRAPVKKITLPKTLTIVYKDSDDYSINKLGDNQTFKIGFKSAIDQKTYNFVVLTNWGEIIEKQT